MNITLGNPFKLLDLPPDLMAHAGNLIPVNIGFHQAGGFVRLRSGSPTPQPGIALRRLNSIIHNGSYCYCHTRKKGWPSRLRINNGQLHFITKKYRTL